jgi:hypothetical protein
MLTMTSKGSSEGAVLDGRLTVGAALVGLAREQPPLLLQPVCVPVLLAGRDWLAAALKQSSLKLKQEMPQVATPAVFL